MDRSESTNTISPSEAHRRLVKFLADQMVEGWEPEAGDGSDDKILEVARIEQVLFFLYHALDADPHLLELTLPEKLVRWLKIIAPWANHGE